MECGEFQQILIASSDEDPSQGQAELLELHASSCAACCSLVDSAASELRAMARPLYSGVDRPVDWDPVFQQVLAGVNSPAEDPVLAAEPGAVVAGAPQPGRARGDWRSWYPLLAVAAALILSAGVALLAPGVGSSPSGSSQARGCCEGGVEALPVGQGARLDYLETAPEVVAVAMMPQGEEEVLVIFLQAVADEGG